MTNESKDIKFVGISVKDGQARLSYQVVNSHY